MIPLLSVIAIQASINVMWIYIPQQVDKQSLTSVSPAFFKDSRVFAGTIILYNDSAAYAKFS